MQYICLMSSFVSQLLNKLDWLVCECSCLSSWEDVWVYKTNKQCPLNRGVLGCGQNWLSDPFWCMFPYWRLQNVCDQDYDPVFSLTDGVVLYEVTINVVFCDWTGLWVSVLYRQVRTLMNRKIQPHSLMLVTRSR